MRGELPCSDHGHTPALAGPVEEVGQDRQALKRPAGDRGRGPGQECRAGEQDSTSLSSRADGVANRVREASMERIENTNKVCSSHIHSSNFKKIK